MGLGVIEDHAGLDRVPATVLLADLDQETHVSVVSDHLKKGSGRNKDIILNPQPSNDPNDPLNWPYYQKFVIVLILVFGTSLNACTLGPLLTSSIVALAEDLNRPITDITLLTGYTLVVAGGTGPFISGLSIKYGKRPVFLFSSTIVVIGSIVGCFSQTYKTLVAARVIQGFGIAAYESLTFSVVSDLFYVHQRGFWINVISFTLVCGSSFSSVISGPVALNLGWHYLFYLIVACSGLQTILLFLFCPETSYIRDPIFNQHSALGGTGDEIDEKVSGTVSEHMDCAYPSPPLAKTYWQKLAPYNGAFSNESLLKLILGPFLCVTNMAALWLVVITGAVTSFYVGISYITAQLFTVPPYLLSTAGVGYLSLGPTIGSFLGSVVVALVTDPLAIWMAKHNRGIYEPEFRLPICAFGLIGVAGFASFGAVSQAQGNIYLIEFLWGLALFGVCFVVGPCSSYVVDAYRDMGSEIFVASVMFKNFLFFGYSYFVNNWVASAGPAIPYYVFSSVAAGLVLTVIPAYMFGKQYRSFWSRYNVMVMLKFKTHSEF